MTSNTHLAPLDASRTKYHRTLIGGLGGSTRRETWGAFTADGVWEFEREDSPSTPWLVRHVETGIVVTMYGSLRACREAVGRGYAARRLAEIPTELAELDRRFGIIR
jgi:hypothetical protein